MKFESPATVQHQQQQQQQQQPHRNCHNIEEIADETILSAIKEKSFFYVADLFDIYKKHLKWIQMMPRVKPYYMMKCNQLPEIVSLFASLGTGFCCTNKQEIDNVLAAGVDASSIVYSNPCKTRMAIKQAKNLQVELMSFDNESELRKIAQLNPSAKLILRIECNQRADDASRRNQQQFLQFGTNLDHCYDLFKLAKQLEVDVVGVSFHNGSKCQDADIYYQSIATCKSVFELGQELGHDNMNLLDIGGGFPGDKQAKLSFEKISSVINEALDVFFPVGCGVDIIAEPGRFYVSSAMTFLAKVINKQVVANPGDEQPEQDSSYQYSLGDGVYGAFNDVLLNANSLAQPRLLNESLYMERKMRSSTLWGPTSDPSDCIRRDFMFPELEIGEWVVFKNKGAYSCCLSSSINNMDQATVIIANKQQFK